MGLPQTTHPLANLGNGGLFSVNRGRQLAIGHDIQAVRNLKELIQLFTDHQHRTTGIAQRQQLAANLRSSAYVHTPSGLRHQQHFGVGVYLSAHNEFLQITARQ